MKLILLVLLIPFVLYAQENNGRMRYEVKSSSLILASEYISRGIPLAAEFILESDVGRNAENIGQFLKQKTESQDLQTDKTIDLTNGIVNSLPTDTGMSRTGPGTLYSKVEIDKYFKCLLEVAPYVKKYEALKRQKYIELESKELLLDELAMRINRDRAIGGRLNKEGHICGRYLGPFSVVEFSDKLLLKYIEVIKRLPLESRKELLAAFITFLHPDSPLEQRLVLLHLVKFEMARIYFSKSNEFKFSNLENLYLQLASESSSQKVVDQYSNQNIFVKTDWLEINKAFQWAKSGISL